MVLQLDRITQIGIIRNMKCCNMNGIWLIIGYVLVVITMYTADCKAEYIKDLLPNDKSREILASIESMINSDSNNTDEILAQCELLLMEARQDYSKKAIKILEKKEATQNILKGFKRDSIPVKESCLRAILVINDKNSLPTLIKELETIKIPMDGSSDYIMPYMIYKKNIIETISSISGIGNDFADIVNVDMHKDKVEVFIGKAKEYVTKHNLLPYKQVSEIKVVDTPENVNVLPSIPKAPNETKCSLVYVIIALSMIAVVITIAAVKYKRSKGKSISMI